MKITINKKELTAFFVGIILIEGYFFSRVRRDDLKLMREASYTINTLVKVEEKLAEHVDPVYIRNAWTEARFEMIAEEESK